MDGHVALQDGKVVVSSVYTVKDVDMSTGNIVYDGSVEITGSVAANMEVKAGGNVVINGGVESARIIAGGNIIIAKGMNGTGKGYLRAGGDIMVKFLENTRVVTGVGVGPHQQLVPPAFQLFPPAAVQQLVIRPLSGQPHTAAPPFCLTAGNQAIILHEIGRAHV